MSEIQKTDDTTNTGVTFHTHADRLSAIHSYPPRVRDALLTLMNKPKSPPVTISARLVDEDAMRFARLKNKTNLKVNDLIKLAFIELEKSLDGTGGVN